MPTVVTVDEVKSASQWWTYSSAKAKRELGWRARSHEETIEATVAWWVEREGDRLARSPRSQPLQYKLAGRAIEGGGEAARVVARLVRRG